MAQRGAFRGSGFALMMGMAAIVLAAIPYLLSCQHKVGKTHTIDAAPHSVVAQPDRTVPADPRLEEARIALDRRDFPRALRLCEAARRLRVPLPAVLEMETDVFRETAYLDREIQACQQWSAAAPRDQHAWLRLFYIYLDLGWRTQAGQASERAMRIAPDDPRSQVTRALYYFRSNEPALGLPFIEKARQLDSANADLANLHATILIKALRFSEAEAITRQLLARDPLKTADRLLLAQALVGQGKTPEAVTLLQDMQRREPNNIDVAYLLGVQAQKRGDLTEATRQLERVAGIDRHYSNVLWYLGRLYMQQGHAAEGRKLLQLFKAMDDNTNTFDTALARLQTRPGNADIHYELAQFHLAADELPQAIVELRRTLELRPHDLQARRDLITVLARHGRTTEAQQLASAGVGLQASR